MVSLERGPDSKLSILIVVVALIVALYRSPSLSPNSYPGRLASSQFPEKELRRGAHLCFTPSCSEPFGALASATTSNNINGSFLGFGAQALGFYLDGIIASPKACPCPICFKLVAGFAEYTCSVFLDSILEAKFRQHLCPDHLYPLAQDITSMLCLEFPFWNIPTHQTVRSHAIVGIAAATYVVARFGLGMPSEFVYGLP